MRAYTTQRDVWYL